MDDAQRSHFREKGWIVVKDVLSADLIAQVLFDPAHSYPVGKWADFVDVTAQANEIYDAHLDGSVAAHPEDGAWDGHSYTHSWYNTGQRRPEEERIGRPRILWGKPYYESKRTQLSVPTRLLVLL